jgi:two-component system, response regulator, stage 0 sporulation protein F
MEKIINILYVDDEPINLMLFKNMFKNRFNIYTTESPMSGFSILKETPDINVVISDMRMPKMNGIEFISKARDLYPHIYYFILTGYEITQEIQECLNQGLICRYLQKPFNIKEIEEAITEKLQSI